MLSQAEWPGLTADCGNCAALCCVALSFDEGDSFAFDKPAGRPCKHLCDDNTCSIHDGLADKGFAGCVAYDCLGAGQRVVQEVLAGQDWRESEDALKNMLFAFASMREIHEALALIDAARKLDLPEDHAKTLGDIAGPFLPQDGWSMTTLADFDIAASRKALDAFLPALAPFARR